MSKIIRARDLTSGQRFTFDGGPVLTAVEVLTHSHPLTGHGCGVRTVESAEVLYVDYSDQVTLA